MPNTSPRGAQKESVIKTLRLPIWQLETLNTAGVNINVAYIDAMSKRLLGNAAMNQPAFKVKSEWSDEELKFLHFFYNKIDNKLISEYMGRSVAAIVAQAGKLGLQKRQRRLSDSEKEFIRKNYRRMKMSELSQKLKIGYQAIRHHVDMLKKKTGKKIGQPVEKRYRMPL
jgi:hypothetical protein